MDAERKLLNKMGEACDEASEVTLVCKASCLRQPEKQLPSSSYSHNTLSTTQNSLNSQAF